MLPAPLAEAYDYLPPDGEIIEAGKFVEVPFGGRKMNGVVWGDGKGDVPVAKLKTVLRVVDAPPAPEVSRALSIGWRGIR